MPTVKIITSWTSTKDIHKLWSKQSQDSNGTWNSIKLLDDKIPDYIVVVNNFNQIELPPFSKVVYLYMEPTIQIGHAQIKEKSNFIVSDWIPSDTVFNNLEWHLSKTYSELVDQSIDKPVDKQRSVSAILTCKTNDPGQQLRVALAKTLARRQLDQTLNFKFDLYGGLGDVITWNSEKFKFPSLPYHQKDAGLNDYRYHIAIENTSLPGYVTEKLIDGILSEALVFYWGCTNIAQLIDSRAYIKLPLDSQNNFARDIKIISDAIDNDEWGARIEIIRQQKLKILNQLQFFPRLEQTILNFEAARI